MRPEVADDEWAEERIARIPRLGKGAIGLTGQSEHEIGQEPLAWVASVLECDSYASAALLLTTQLATRFGCARVALGFERRGSIQVEALSHTAHFDPRAALVRQLAAAMHEACDQDASIAHPAPPGQRPRVTRDHARLAELHGALATCSIPLVFRGRAVGGLTFERHEGDPFDASEIRRLEELARVVGPILALQRSVDRSGSERLRVAVHQLATRLLGPDHPHAKIAAACAALLLLLSVGVPGTHRVTADATLEGLVQRAVVAGLDGYISEASARAGDIVEAGQLLGRLDERDLELERRKWAAREQQQRREYREALARHDRTERSILQARLDESRAQVELLDEQLARTRLVAPFGGIVVRGDLSQSLGSPVERGDVLYEIAPLGGYRIILEVDERDVSRIEVGYTGQLALSALPGEPLPLRIENVTPVATAEDGRNFFRVEASLENPPDSLRPGMEGVARIDAGRRRLIWIWTHDLVDWLRLLAWSWLP